MPWQLARVLSATGRVCLRIFGNSYVSRGFICAADAACDAHSSSLRRMSTMAARDLSKKLLKLLLLGNSTVGKTSLILRFTEVSNEAINGIGIPQFNRNWHSPRIRSRCRPRRPLASVRRSYENVCRCDAPSSASHKLGTLFSPGRVYH
jgi:hypothetical protein